MSQSPSDGVCLPTGSMGTIYLKSASRNPLQIGSAFQRMISVVSYCEWESQSPSDRVCFPTTLPGGGWGGNRLVAIPFRSGLLSNREEIVSSALEVEESQSPSDRVCFPTQSFTTSGYLSFWVAIPFRSGLLSNEIASGTVPEGFQSQSPSDRVCLPTWTPDSHCSFSVAVAIPFRSGLPSNLGIFSIEIIGLSRNPLQIGSAFQPQGVKL